MNTKKEMTAPITSVGADEEQSNSIKTNTIITDYDENCNASDDIFQEMQEEFQRSLEPSYLKTVSMDKLYDTVYRSRPPIIDGLLYPGTYLFVGAPKLGKSFLMAQFAYHISTGKSLWGFDVKQGTVLYLALEDDYRRLQERFYRMFGDESTDDLFIAVNAGQLGNGLDEQLNRFVNEHTNTKLIIIDTLQKVREFGGDKYSYSNDYEVITRLKKFADNFGVCLLLVHHTRKQQADDKFDMISGTNGLLGAADGAFMLQKEKRTSNNAVLEISGRDQQDKKLYLVRDTEKLLWDLERLETELWKEPPEPILEAVAKFITSNNPQWSGSPTELVEKLQVDMAANVLTLKLNVNAGRLLNEYGIRYEYGRYHAGRRVKFSLIEN